MIFRFKTLLNSEFWSGLYLSRKEEWSRGVFKRGPPQEFVDEHIEVYDVETEKWKVPTRKEKEELLIIERYLPKQLSDEDIESAIKEIIENTGAEGMKDMGKVMGIASKKLAGKAEGRKIAEITKKLLVNWEH